MRFAVPQVAETGTTLAVTARATTATNAILGMTFIVFPPFVSSVPTSAPIRRQVPDGRARAVGSSAPTRWGADAAPVGFVVVKRSRGTVAGHKEAAWKRGRLRIAQKLARPRTASSPELAPVYRIVGHSVKGLDSRWKSRKNTVGRLSLGRV